MPRHSFYRLDSFEYCVWCCLYPALISKEGGCWADTGFDAQAGTSGTFFHTTTGGEEVEEGTYYFATRSTDNAENIEEEPSG